MLLRCVTPLLILTVVTGCATPRTVRLETGHDSFVVTPRVEPGAELEAAELDDSEFEAAIAGIARDVRPQRNPMQQARDLFGVPARSGVYGYEGRPPRLIPLRRGDSSGPPHVIPAGDRGVTSAGGAADFGARSGADHNRRPDQLGTRLQPSSTAPC